MEARPQSHIVLVVEDNDDDFEAVESALQYDRQFAGSIKRCASGHDALDFLKSRRGDTRANDEPLPSLIILDLNLLGVTGLEVLACVKADETLKMIPVIVMTSSTDQRDIEACYRAGANAYLQKEMELDGLFSAVARLKEFWLETAILPSVD